MRPSLPILLLAGFAGLTACGKQNAATSSIPSSSDTGSIMAQIALQSSDDAGSNSNQAAGTNAGQAPSSVRTANSSCLGITVTTLTGASLKPPFTAAGGNLSLTLTNCPIGRGGMRSGTSLQTLSFNGSVLTDSITNNFVDSFGTNESLETVSDPNITLVITPAPGKVNAIVTGAERRKRHVNNILVHDIEVTHNGTQIATTVDSSHNAVTRTVNGTLTVRHNLAMATATVTKTNIVLNRGSGACCYPVSGTLETNVKFDASVKAATTSALAANIKIFGNVDFDRINTYSSTCGVVSVLQAGHTTTVTLPVCTLP